MTQEALKLAFEAFQYVVTPSGGTRAYVWDSSEARLVADAYRALEKALAQEQEPIAFYNPQQGGFYWAKPTTISCPQTVDVTPLAFYIKSPQRTWVGLTDVEIDYLLGSTVGENEETHISFARVIEAKLKELNDNRI